ncbi:hypothetical protein [Aureispira anguillae]|uniref:Uncharacterized protein n=1 Tax=Aureispira anguillae TaxID=2864201 RepID=A0A915YKC9_9BACT|nr:hypothetical protein [Aureispira anguillae]BDS14557.1 hypothetical protein AsAng_0053380 [Aureispira anguillae]
MPSSPTISTKKVFWLGLFSYAILAILAIVFYKERTIFADVAFRFFAMIKDGDYAIQVHRFGSFFTQSFLYLSHALGLPLKNIMINYSVGFIAYKALVFVLCFKVLRQPTLAITLLFTDILIVAETFYWIQSELVESITFIILYFAVLKHISTKKLHLLRLLLVLGMLITVLFFHPLAFILFLFMSLFSFLSTEEATYKKYLVGGLPIAVIILVVKSLYFKSPYDNSGISLMQNFINSFPNYLGLPSNYRFLTYVVQDYYFLPIFLFILLGYYRKHQLWLKFGVLASFFFGYLFLVNVCFPHNNVQFHMESFYMPLSLFVALPFALDILPLVPKNRILILLSLVISCRLIHIGFQHQKFTDCLDWKRELLQKTASSKNKKLAISAKHVPMDTLMLSWGSSYEFWMLSTIESGESRSVIIYDDRKRLTQWGKMKHTKLFITQWGATLYQDLPKEYFNFQDTTTTYVDYNPQLH